MSAVSATLPSPGRSRSVALGRPRRRLEAVRPSVPTHPTVVAGYRIGPILGRGGMSVVFEVVHPTMREHLAMKVVTDRLLQNDLAFDAIYTHARRMAAVSSPHVVRTLDAGRLPTREPFIVMERLSGEDLAARLTQRGALPIAEAIRLAMQACSGLHAAHSIGVVHGDIKPGNLFIVDSLGSPTLKIVDFAPSVPRAARPDDPLVTCSPGYASPEQLGARTDVDARADVWAMGAVLYELVTGRRAFEASTLPEMLQIIRRAPANMASPFGEVPPALDRIMRRCLSYAREGRYESALQLRAALEKVANELERVALASFRNKTTARSPRRLVVGRSERAEVTMSPLARKILLAALGPASALLSMTIVRLLLASGFMANHLVP